jgi:hypothetical protein
MRAPDSVRLYLANRSTHSRPVHRTVPENTVHCPSFAGMRRTRDQAASSSVPRRRLT